MFTKARPIKQPTCGRRWIRKNYSSTTESRLVKENNSFYKSAGLPGHWTPSGLVQHDGMSRFTLHSTCLKHLNNCLKTNRSVYTMFAVTVVISTLKKSYERKN